MLNKISIKNYALIEELEIRFSGGLTIITGETGAGKSILLGALSLLLGARTDSGSLFNKSKKCVVEGEFDIKGYDLGEFFQSNDLDYENLTTIRRELSPEGKSRAFINDTPVNVSVLKVLGQKLIEVHSQHETLTLNDSEFQMMVVDSIAGTGKQLNEYGQEFLNYSELKTRLQQLRLDQQKASADLDYYSFLFNEIESASLKSGEQEELENELQLLNNSTEIKEALSSSSGIISGDNDNLVSSLNLVLNRITGITKVFPQAQEVRNRIQSILIELKDIGDETEQLEREVTFDPSRAEVISDRLDLIYSLQKKHRVISVGQLIEIYNELDSKLNSIGSLDDQILKLEKEIDSLHKSLLAKATLLSKKRKEAIPGIESSLKNLLVELGMKHAVLKVDLQSLPENELRKHGIDTVRLLFSANKGIEYKELNKVASGGELSRLMLAIKSLIAKFTGLPTIIFDEIDTGVSGEIAHKAGNLIRKIAGERQVVVITHLPQMAGKGDEHLLVYKESEGATAQTRIRKLNKQERVEEIAKMLSGEHPTKSALANARELLEA